MARKKDKLVLVNWLANEDRSAWKTAQEKLGRTLSYEFEVVALADDAEGLANKLGMKRDEGKSWLSIHDPAGKLLHQGPARELLEGGAAFVEAHRLPEKDGNALLAAALADAKASNRRVLIHLGAPW
jgi:hypothetical protein